MKHSAIEDEIVGVNSMNVKRRVLELEVSNVKRTREIMEHYLTQLLDVNKSKLNRKGTLRGVSGVLMATKKQLLFKDLFQ